MKRFTNTEIKKVIKKLDDINYINADRINNCSKLLFVNSSMDKNTGECWDNIRGFYRCKDSMCPLCHNITMCDYQRKLNSIHSNLENNTIFFTISPTRTHPNDLLYIKRILTNTVSRIKKDVAFRKIGISGYVYSWEFGQPKDGEFIHLHLHGIFSMKKSVKGRNFISADYFQNMVQNIFDNLLKETKLRGIEVSTDIKSFPDDSGIKALNYMLKSKEIENFILELKPNYLKDFCNVIKNFRYVTFGGNLRPLSMKVNNNSSDSNQKYNPNLYSVSYFMSKKNSSNIVKKNPELQKRSRICYASH